jgi:hypothetical protein
MTTLVAIAEPGRAQRSEPRPSSLLLSALLHTLVLLLLVLMAQWVPPPTEVAVPPQERLIEVVMAPPPPTPSPPVPQSGEIPVERMNLSEDAEVAQESRAPPAAPPGQAEPPAEQPPQRTRDQDLPTAPIAAAPPTPEAAPAPQPVPPQPQPRPAPPARPPARFEIDPRDIRSFEPPPGVGQPQVASVPRLEPQPQPPRPTPRAAAPQLPPRPQATQNPGELREVDLFGNARLPPRRAAAAQPSNAALGPRSTASEAAYILRQVLRVWTVDYRNPRYHDMTLSLRMPLQADGTLGFPWGRNDPWQPYLLIENYQEFLRPGMESERRLLESFAYAVKLAQPYQIPPTPGPYPRTVTINFRMGDL